MTTATIPTLVTIAAFIWALWPREDEQSPGVMCFDAGSGIGLLIRAPVTCTISLAAWFVWSLFS